MSACLLLLTYNQNKFIKEAVTSVLQQECEPLQIVISDDASADSTFEIVKQVVGSYTGPHEVILNKNDSNMGLIGHLNKCIELSDAEYFIGAAGDDISVPLRVDRILKKMRAKDALLVHSLVQPIDEMGLGITAAPHLLNPIFFKDYKLSDVATATTLYIGATVGWHKLLFSKYGKIKFTDVYEDLILGFRAALEGRIEFIDEALVKYRMNGGVSSPQREWNVKERTLFLQRQLSVLEQRSLDANTAGNVEVDKIIQREAACLRSQIKIYTSKRSFALDMIMRPLVANEALSRERKEWREG